LRIERQLRRRQAFAKLIDVGPEALPGGLFLGGKRRQRFRLTHGGEVRMRRRHAAAARNAVQQKEQGRLLALLIERIDYDGRDGSICISFHAEGIRTLAAKAHEGDAA
jgi:hypothetical protein